MLFQNFRFNPILEIGNCIDFLWKIADDGKINLDFLLFFTLFILKIISNIIFMLKVFYKQICFVVLQPVCQWKDSNRSKIIRLYFCFSFNCSFFEYLRKYSWKLLLHFQSSRKQSCSQGSTEHGQSVCVRECVHECCIEDF